eukprot:Seg2123.3 transcript_id=Seg2123.3/GoldUCD/mRNA.D3Y31 product="hypothetical protein" pseudo=true protein_id=Seg2123.3/GoldUCD/D3Y31
MPSTSGTPRVIATGNNANSLPPNTKEDIAAIVKSVVKESKAELAVEIARQSREDHVARRPTEPNVSSIPEPPFMAQLANLEHSP